MTIILYGMAGGFLVTRGYGNAGVEPPPIPPTDDLEDAVLGEMAGGMFASTERPEVMESE